MDEFCTYCGTARGDRLSCCGENHFMTTKEFKDYHGDWPDGPDEEAAYYDELERGYAKDRI